MNWNRIVIGAALMAALSVVLEAFLPAPKIGFIDLDFVGVPWGISTLIFGPFGGLITSAATALFIFFGESGWIGAVMKFSATIPTVLALAFIRWKRLYSWRFLAAAFIIATVLRVSIMVPLNYYFAIPLFVHISVEEAFARFPVLPITVVPNIIVSAIEFAVIYAVVFGSKLKRELND